MQSAARRALWAAVARRRGSQGFWAHTVRRDLHQQGGGTDKEGSVVLRAAAGLLGLGGLGLGSYTLYHISSQQQSKKSGDILQTVFLSMNQSSDDVILLSALSLTSKKLEERTEEKWVSEFKKYIYRKFWIRRKSRDGASSSIKLFDPAKVVDFLRPKKNSPSVDEGSANANESEDALVSVEEHGSVEDREKLSSQKSVAADQEISAEESSNTQNKDEISPCTKDEGTTDDSATVQKEEKSGDMSVEPSSESVVQVQQTIQEDLGKNRPQLDVEKGAPPKPVDGKLQLREREEEAHFIQESLKDLSPEPSNDQYGELKLPTSESERIANRNQLQSEALSGEPLTVWNVYCAIKEAVERQKTEDDEILSVALQNQEEKNQRETLKILENCNNTLKSLTAMTEKAVELEGRYREVENELKNTLEALKAAKVSHAETTIAERKVRMQMLDNLREQLNALTQAFGKRSAERRRSHRAHKLAMGAFALDTAIQNGSRPLRGAVEVIKKAAVAQAPGSEGFYGKGKDELMTVALEAVPEATLDRGVDTREKLYVDLQTMKLDIRALSLIPVDGGGFLAFVAAYAVSTLKFEEPTTRKRREIGRLECTLATVESLFRSGDLSAAADTLEQALKGTAALNAASSWIEHVRHRALCEQTLELVRAHSTVLAAALS